MTLRVGDPAPSFTLPDAAGHPVSLADHLPAVVYFYPRAMTPGCTTQACDLRDRQDLLTGAGYSVLGISPDPAERLARFRDRYGIDFPLLSDADHTVAAAYGAWGTKQNYGRTYQGMIRSTFVVDTRGAVAGVWYNVRASGHGDRVLRHLGM